MKAKPPIPLDLFMVEIAWRRLRRAFYRWRIGEMTTGEAVARARWAIRRVRK